MVCRICGKPLPSGMKFCQFCGTKVMAVCPVCGTENDPSGAFCTACGHEIGEKKETVFNNFQQPPMPPRMSTAGGLRSQLVSTAMLVGSVLLSISLAFFLFAGSGGNRWFWNSDLYDTLYDIAWMIDMEDLLDALVGARYMASGTAFFSNLLKQWPLAVVLVGLWMTYSAAKNTGHGAVNEGGMKAIAFVGRFFHVIYILAMIAFSVAMIYAAVVCADSWFFEELTGYCVLALFVGDGILFAFVVFFKKMADTVANVRSALQRGASDCAVSRYVVAVLYILASCKAILALVSIGSGFAAFVSGACYAAGLFVFATLLNRCKPSAMPYMNV